MSFIGNQPISAAFLTDTFNGNGTTTAFTLSAAPAGSSSILVAISGVVQAPATYGVVGTTLNFSAAPPVGTASISVRYLGIPASGVTTTAYRTLTEFTATASQTTFTPPSYTVGFLNVYRNGVMLGSADYTATNGTTVVLAVGALVGDTVTTESFYVSSVLNAIPATAGAVNSSYIASGAVTLTTQVTGTLPEANGGTGATTGYYGFKNRIINGAMQIDQRRVGASATVTGANEAYTVDRFFAAKDTVAGTFTVQQTPSATETGFATRVSAGFTNYSAITIGTAWTAASGDGATFQQRIEGLNISDLAWGTANAKTVTLSFLVYSSLTGTFSGSLVNSAVNRSYPYTYSIPVANTWTQISVTITGDTSGTWLTTNGTGIRVYWNLGSGSGFLGTADAWTGSLKVGVTGSVALSQTAGATFYITGVQLEKGSTATSFDYRPYGTELDLCYRYYQRNIFVAVGGAATPTVTNRSFYNAINFQTSFRASPTMALISTITSINMNAGAWANLSADRGRFSATNSVANDCVLEAQYSGESEL